MASFQADFLKDLECPVCNEYMYAEIQQCSRGHSICSKCKSKCSLCPQCQGNFGNIRNYTLEKLVEFVQLPCPNQVYGCEKYDKGINISKHIEEECEFIEFYCPLAEIKNCNWTGYLANVNAHLKEMHNHKNNEHMQYLFDKRNIVFYQNNNRLFKVIRQRLKNGLVEFSVQFIGPKKMANSFIFQINFIDQTGYGHETNISGQVIPYCSDDEAFDQDKIVVHDSTLKYFRKANAYYYKVSVQDKHLLH